MNERLKARLAKRIVAYYLFGRKELAYQISRLYLQLAKISQPDEESVTAACMESLYWLKLSGCHSAEQLRNLKIIPLTEQLADLLRAFRASMQQNKKERQNGFTSANSR